MSVGPRQARTRQRSRISQRVQQLSPSGIRRFFDLIATMEDVVSLGVGEPDFVTPWHIREAAIHALKKGYTHYTSNFGLIELRRAVAQHLEARYSVRYDPEDEVLITVGVSEALDVAMRAVLDPGDEVIVPEPTYVSYLPCVALPGGVFVPVPTYVENDFKVQTADIEARVTARTKAILLGYPNNPTGAVLDRAELTRIVEMARRHDLLLVSDEIYDRLVYGVEHTCVAALPGAQERTILLGGLSKSYAMTGWRIGYAAAPAEIIEGMMKVHQYTLMCAPTLGQFAALEALRSGEEDVQRMIAEYNGRRRLIVQGLNDIGLTCFEPRGAFYAFPSIKVTGLTSQQFAEKLLVEEKVAVVPGDAFGPSGEGHVRCCYAVGTEQIKEALVRTGRFVERHRRRG